MKYTITLEDKENGQVNVNSTPHMKTLAAMARGKDITPAGAYALAALAKIITDSKKNLEDEVKAKFEAGQIPAFKSNRPMLG